MGSPILQWAPRHFCSTPAVRRTPPLELTRWSITMAGATTMLSAILRFLTTSTEPKTTLLATLRSWKTFTAIGDTALWSNDVTGHGLANQNTAVGASALGLNIDASENTAVGYNALAGNDLTGHG